MINQAAEDLIVRYEGERLTSYKDTGGIWTIGVGHTSDQYLKVKPGITISKETSRKLLAIDLKEAEAFVDRLVKVPLNANQRGALVSFTFNLGGKSLEISTLLKELNAGNYAAIPSELNKWIFDDGIKLKGLIKRRAAEGVLFNTPTSIPVVVKPTEKPVESVKPVPAPKVPEALPSESGAFLKVILALAGAAAITIANWLGLF